MLQILDRYIIGKYLKTFFYAAILITLFSVVENFAEKVEKFINSGLSAKEIFFDYYLYFIPWINGLLWPLYALIAVIFFTSRMARNSEIISILNAGVSFKRMLAPYLLSAIFISALHWLGSNYVIPLSNYHKNEFESEYLKSTKKIRSTNVHFFIASNEKVYIRFYKTRDSSASTFRLEKFDESGRLISLMKARNIKFKEEPHTWTLEDYSIRNINELSEELIIGTGEKLDTVLKFTPADFIQHTKQMEIMTTSDLRDYIKREQQRGLDNTKKYYIELYRRTADPFTIIILTLIGVSVASRKVRGGIGLHLAEGVVYGSAYVLLSKFSTTFSTNLSLSESQYTLW